MNALGFAGRTRGSIADSRLGPYGLCSGSVIGCDHALALDALRLLKGEVLGRLDLRVTPVG